jgi:predicted nucleotidyltransferase
MTASESDQAAIDQVLDERTRTLEVGPELAALRDAVALRFGDSLVGILLYGSCLRSGDMTDGLVDLYVVVDGYSRAYGRTHLAVLNWLLPPNVFYIEVDAAASRIRAKFAVVSLNDLLRGTTNRWFNPYLWGRFAQPMAQLAARDRQAAMRMRAALLQASTTLLHQALPMLPPRFTARELWETALALSYRTELRPEGPNRVVHLYDTYPRYYEALTGPLLDRLPYGVSGGAVDKNGVFSTDIPRRVRTVATVAWFGRRVQGRALHVLRLVKAAFTFSGGIDYLLWKLERHTGVRIEETDPVRRHPLIFGWGLLWRLRRRGVIR